MSDTAKKRIKLSGVLLFGIYLLGLIYFLFLSERYGRGAAMITDNCNLHPFYEIRRYLKYWKILGLRTVCLNLAGNVVGFMPFGALLPVFSRGARRAWKTTLLGFEISALIEIAQYMLQVGSFDVDDMILNTTGALLGYLVFWIAEKKYKKTVPSEDAEDGVFGKNR
jgi:glycopeptide antibiotics resistance protein